MQKPSFDSVKCVGKQIVSDFLSKSGMLYLLERMRLKESALVLMYHRVLDRDTNDGEVHPGMYVNVGTFDMHVRYLKNNFHVLFLDELVAKLLRNESVANCCAVTFDDGWLDNYTHALPVLERHRAPATIFLATGFIGTYSIFWPEELWYHLKRLSGKKVSRDEMPPSLAAWFYDFGASGAAFDDSFCAGFIEHMKLAPEQIRKDTLADFRRMLGPCDAGRLMLNWEEVDAMGKTGLVRFGAHSVNHRILDSIDAIHAAEEIAGSGSALRAKCCCVSNIFAFPNGNNNVRLQDVVATSGYSAAVTTTRGFVTSATNPFAIPRVAIHQDVTSTIPRFRSRLLLGKF
ncbi:polysaccharide deacetylase family protein [Geomonas anaerohicana]|uniref:Polysaccharide deacetylase family protein n=1 Tax=Geomonas anaerohicana TaxID=2798583 RepID=A0ABS0YC42_9BACT|nr:polysaccharide deacetylase family protein [Geomonas anaerohicana]MBJ6749826.1 polysaccharide deacetylase family protein [Geomonas anaerohicana]